MKKQSFSVESDECKWEGREGTSWAENVVTSSSLMIYGAMWCVRC